MIVEIREMIETGDHLSKDKKIHLKDEGNNLINVVGIQGVTNKIAEKIEEQQ